MYSICSVLYTQHTIGRYVLSKWKVEPYLGGTLFANDLCKFTDGIFWKFLDNFFSNNQHAKHQISPDGGTFIVWPIVMPRLFRFSNPQYVAGKIPKSVFREYKPADHGSASNWKE